MTTARKFFAENVAIAGTTAVSMATLMSTAGWGWEADATTNAITTTPSLDSQEGNGGSILPAADIYVGHDQYVRDVAGVGPPRVYQGAIALANKKFGLDDFCRGIVDPTRIWFYAAVGTTADLVFDGF